MCESHSGNDSSVQIYRGDFKPLASLGAVFRRQLVERVNKRLARWRALGARQVPVVIEPSRGPVETYAALLLSNSPPRTLTPMDEARVVFALRHEAGLGPATIAKLLGRKRRWVFYRLALAERLSPEVAQQVDAGRIGVTLAHDDALGAHVPCLRGDEVHVRPGRKADDLESLGVGSGDLEGAPADRAGRAEDGDARPRGGQGAAPSA